MMITCQRSIFQSLNGHRKNKFVLPPHPPFLPPHPPTLPQCIKHQTWQYRIAENFRGRKLSWIGEKYVFHGENFCGLLAFAAPKDPTPQILRRKLSRIATKLWNSQSFLPQKFPAIRYLPWPSSPPATYRKSSSELTKDSELKRKHIWLFETC